MVNKNNPASRLEAIKLAEEIGPVKAAAVYGVDRKTIFRWIKSFQESGEKTLCNKSRIYQQHPQKMPSATVEKILAFKKAHPDSTISRIITELNLDYSKATVAKIIRRADIQVNSIQTIPVFNQSYYIHYVREATVPALANGQNIKLYCLEKLPAGLLCCAVADENTQMNSAIFLDIALSLLHLPGDQAVSGIYISGRITAGSAPAAVAHQKFGLQLLDKQQADEISTGFKAFKELLDFETADYDKDNLAALICSAAAFHNYSSQTAIKDRPELKRWCSFPPVLLSDYIKEFQQIITGKYEWTNLLSDQDLTARIEILKRHSEQFFKTGKINAAIMALDTALLIAVDRSLLPSIINLNNLKGSLFKKNGQYQQAKEAYFSALKLAEQHNDPDIIAQCCDNLGEQFLQEKKFTEALKYFRKELNLAGRNQNAGIVINAAISIGYLYQFMDRFDAAKTYLIKAYRQAVKIGDKFSEVRSLINLGILYTHKKNFRLAEKYYREALELAGISGNQRQEITTLINLSIIEFLAGHYQKAHEYYDKAITYLDSDYEIRLIIPLYHNMINLLIFEESYKEAIALNSKLYEIAKKNGDQANIIFSLVNQATIFQRIGSKKRIMPKFDQALKICEANNLEYLHLALLADCAISAIECTDYETMHKKLTIARAEAERLNQINTMANLKVYAKLADYLFRPGSSKNSERVISEIKAIVDTTSGLERIEIYAGIYRFFNRNHSFSDFNGFKNFCKELVINYVSSKIPKRDKEGLKNVINRHLGALTL